MHRISRLFVAGAHWFRQHQRTLLGGFCVLAVVALAVFVPTHFSFAQDVDTAARGQVGVDDFINLLARLLNGLASGIGNLVLGLIGMILIPLLNYDGFSTSYIVGLGWALVRDTVNMFVVVVLLVIAVLTIVGSPKVNWQQQIPRLFIYVVMVNFSRTICGFLIDIGNVIMFQFVNALVEIGAGNFANLLKLNIAGDYSGGIDNTHAIQNFFTAYFQVMLMTMVLAIVGIIAIVFIYRIVVLWVLIIMSPAAFFLGGIKDIFAQAGNAYGQWWKKFSSAIILGPILTFFLWLALAASAGGDIVTKENFPIGDTENFGILLKVFDMSQLTGLLIGVVLLVVGLQQAATAAGALGGIAAKLVNEDMGFKLAKAGLKWPATFGGGAYKAANYVAPETTSAASAFALKQAGGLVSYAGTGLSDVAGKVPLVGGIAAMPFRKISEQGNKLYVAGEHIDEEQMKKARESLKHVPDKYKQEVYKAMEKGDGSFTGLSKWQQEAMYEDMATKTGAQKAALAAFTVPHATDQQKEAARRLHDNLMRKVIKKTKHDVDAGHSGLDDAGKTAFKATMSQYLDVTFKALHDPHGATEAEQNAKAIKFVEEQDSGFTPSMVRERALTGAAGIDNMDRVRRALNRRVTKVLDNGEQVTALHEAERGAYGVRIVRAVDTGRGTLGLAGRDGYAAPGTYGVNGLDPRRQQAAPAGPAVFRGRRPGRGGGTGGGRPRGGGGGGGGRGGGAGGSGGTGTGGGAGSGSSGSGGTGGGTSGGGGPTNSSTGGASGHGGSSGAAGNPVQTAANSAGRARAAARPPAPYGSGAATRVVVEEYDEPEGAQYTGPASDPSRARRVAGKVPETAPERFARERAEEAKAARTVTPFAGADAALEQRQAANNNDNFAGQDDQSANNNAGFRDVA